MKDYRKHAYPYLDLFKGIKMLVLDNDGIMTTGRVHYFDNETAVGISYSVLDGYSMARIKQIGVRVAIISGRFNPALQHRVEVLGINPEDVHMGVMNKAKYLEELYDKYGLTKDEVAFMGDDFIDLSALKVVGLPITVPNCHPMVESYCKYKTKNKGGAGAIREVCDLIHIANNDQETEMGQALSIFWKEYADYKDAKEAKKAAKEEAKAAEKKEHKKDQARNNDQLDGVLYTDHNTKILYKGGIPAEVPLDEEDK